MCLWKSAWFTRLYTFGIGISEKTKQKHSYFKECLAFWMSSELHGSLKSSQFHVNVCTSVTHAHSWVLSPLPVHSNIGLSPIWEHSDIRQKGSQSHIISNIRLTFLAISDIIQIFVFVPVFYSKYWILWKQAQEYDSTGLLMDSSWFIYSHCTGWLEYAGLVWPSPGA